jgi:tetratricopeptide (TPR) repeat protein
VATPCSRILASPATITSRMKMHRVLRFWEPVLTRMLLLATVAVLPGCGGKQSADDSPRPQAPERPARHLPIARAPASSAATAPPVSREGNLAAALSDPSKAPASKGTADKSSADKSSADKTPDGKTLISDAEAQEFVTAFDKALTAGDAKALGEAFNDEAMIRKAVAGLGLPPAEGDVFINGTVKQASRGQGVGSEYASRVASGGKYRLLHIRKHGPWQCAVFRFVDNKDHMDYYEFLLTRDAADKVRISDIYDYGFAELHTLELARSIQCELVEERPEAAKAYPGIVEYAKHRSELNTMGSLVYDKKYSAAIAIYEKLPESMKKSREAIIHRVSACHKEKDQCDGLIGTFREKFPHDTGLDLFMGQYNLALRRWDEALASIDVLDKQIGGDPYLNSERALAQLYLGNLAEAKKLLQKSGSEGPGSEPDRELQKQVAELEKGMGGTSAAEEAPGKPASEEEAKAFAEQFVKCVMSGDAEAIKKCIDVASFYRRATAAIEIPGEMKLPLESGFRSGDGAHIADFFHLDKEQLAKGASFHLLRLHSKNGEERAVFRKIRADGGVEHYDCILEKFSDGTVRVADYYDLSAGGMKSELDGLYLSDAVKKYKPSSDDEPKQPTEPKQPAEDPLSFASALTQMQRCVAEGRYQEALAVYGKLPEDLQKEKHILLTRVHAAIHLEGEPFDSAIRDFRKSFPNAANIDLVMIDAYAAKKLYDRALTSIDSLDHKIGGDPYLDVMRAEVHMLKKDVNSARRLARKAADADPSIYQAYKILLPISLRQKKFTETTTLLTAVQKLFPQCMPNVTSDAEYAEYIKSPSFKAWMKKQNQKG